MHYLLFLPFVLICSFNEDLQIRRQIVFNLHVLILGGTKHHRQTVIWPQTFLKVNLLQAYAHQQV